MGGLDKLGQVPSVSDPDPGFLVNLDPDPGFARSWSRQIQFFYSKFKTFLCIVKKSVLKKLNNLFLDLYEELFKREEKPRA